MATLISLVFQGEVAAAGDLAAEEEREAVHAAFPLSPPRDAAVRDGFRAWKIAPLASGRALVSTVTNRGDVDGYGRPVLRAAGCLLAAEEMAGAARDLTALWEALETCDPADGVEALEARVAALSIHSAPEAFALFEAEIERDGAFYARAAAALAGETADLYLGEVERGLDLLRPVLGLLPRRCLHGLHLAIGVEPADVREPILGLAGDAPDSWREGGRLGGLFGRRKEPRSAAAVDFERQEVYGVRSEGPVALAEAIAGERPWPGGLEARERYRVLLQCLDAAEEGETLTPFDVVPRLEELRRAVRRIEKLSAELARWR